MELTRGFYYIQSIATWFQNRRIKISHIVSKIYGDNTDESGAINCIVICIILSSGLGSTFELVAEDKSPC